MIFDFQVTNVTIRLRTMAANDVASGSGKIEYRLLKLPNEVYKHFLVEFKNDRKTEFRKCMRCSTVVKAVNLQVFRANLFSDSRPIP